MIKTLTNEQDTSLLTRVNNQPATQLDVGRLAGVSRSTVSMVLNGSPKICDDTRERVLSVAKKINYSLHGNQAARRMAASQTGKIIPFKTIGLVWPKDFGIHHLPFYQVLFNGICEGCWDAEFSLMLLNVRPSHVEQLAGLSQVDALILPIPSDEHYEMLKKLPIPLITTYFERSGVAHIGIDHAKAIEIAFQHLHENGHRKIGFISPALLKSQSATLRWKAYCEQLQQHGIAYKPDYVISKNEYENEKQAEYSFLELMSLSDKPTSIIFHNDIMALSALKMARKRNIQIPADISFISIDNIPDTEKSNPPLTTVSINMKEIGRKAVAMAVNFINNNNYSPTFEKVPLKLIKRNSVRNITGMKGTR